MKEECLREHLLMKQISIFILYVCRLYVVQCMLHYICVRTYGKVKIMCYFGENKHVCLTCLLIMLH